MDIRETIKSLNLIQEQIADAMETFPEGDGFEVAFDSLDEAGERIEVAIHLVTRQLKNEVPSVSNNEEK